MPQDTAKEVYPYVLLPDRTTDIITPLVFDVDSPSVVTDEKERDSHDDAGYAHSDPPFDEVSPAAASDDADAPTTAPATQGETQAEAASQLPPD